MKGKLLGFGLSLLAVATIGVVQLSTQAAEPGQVGNAARCTVEAEGQRGSAFKVNDAQTKATVDFTVKGSADCKVQLSANSFYAPSMDGRPYDQQVLFDRVTKTYGKGDYSMTVKLPTQSTKQKGCFYQVDLTYGTHNVQPVLAYGHGKIKGCGEEQPNPKAECVEVKAIEQERTKFLVTAKAKVSGGAKIKSYSFKVTKGSATVYDNTYKSEAGEQSVVYIVNEPGEYKVKATVDTSEGVKKGTQCETTFTVKAPPVTPTPGVSIEKFVNNDQKYARVSENVEFSYRVVVKNTGNTDLDNVAVTDTADKGITLLSVTPPTGKITAPSDENGTYTFTTTIPKLLVGESRTFVLKAKVPTHLAGKLKNTVCVDAPAVPGNPDKCDTVEVDLPPKGKVRVCDPASGNIIEVDQGQEGNYKPVDSPDCKDEPTVDTPETPTELPETGPTETILSVIGAMSLVGASAYYVASRRSA
jgi:uncharacterized repeat protein (TIGR01451 family)/LPXTG-motif cell wall-anchored protein